MSVMGAAARWSTLVLALTVLLGAATVVVAFAWDIEATQRVYAPIGAALGTAIAVVGRLVVTGSRPRVEESWAAGSRTAGSWAGGPRIDEPRADSPRVDGPRIGLLTQCCGLLPLAATAFDVAALAWPSPLLHRADDNAWSLNFAPVLVLALCFPDGRPRRGWRVVAWAAALQPVVAIGSAALLGDDAAAPATLALPVLFVLVVVAVIRRYRAADEEGRRLLSWLTATALLTPVALVAADVGYLITGRFDIAGVAVAMLAVGAALAVAVTALRGRLARLDAALAAAVLGVVQMLGVAAIVGIAAVVVQALGVPFPGSAIAPALAGLVGFAPLLVLNRRWVRNWLQPRRRRALAIARAFVADVREGAEPAERVEDVLREAVGDPSIRLLLADPDGPAGPAGTAGPADPPAAMPPGAVRVLAGRHHVADVIRSPASEVGERELREVLAELRLPIEVVRLRRDLGRSVAEVERSRSRLLAATVAERERLGRDLHDGPQQAIVALGMELRALRRHGRNGTPTGVDLDRADVLVQTALTELRRLAHGASPAGIEAGLLPALRAMVARLPAHVELDLPDQELDEPGRSTAFYVASEAVTNALKHADARRIRVSGGRQAGVFVLRVEDDGQGGADPRGSGLTGLRDRVEAAGGRLAVRSPSGAGTQVEVELPCGS